MSFEMEKLFETLAKLVNEIDSLKAITKPHTDDQAEIFEFWNRRVHRILGKIYGSDSEELASFKRISLAPVAISGGPRIPEEYRAKRVNKAYQRGLSRARAHLQSLIETDGSDFVKQGGIPSVTAFISGSFIDEAESVILWFSDLADACGISTDWLKSRAELRPAESKIKAHLKSADCLIQILTRDVEEQGKERGWLGNEMAWSDEIHGPGRQVLFVEQGVKPTGVGPEITEPVFYNRDRLHEVAPKAVDLLLKLKRNVVGAEVSL